MDLPMVSDHGQTPNICYDKNSRFFTQFKCEETTAEFALKQKSSFIVLTIEVISIFTFIGFLISNYFKSKNLNRKWAQSSVKLSDYSFYYKVRPEDHEEFLHFERENQIDDGSAEFGRGFLFKKYIE